jgi:hypothetical protein
MVCVINKVEYTVENDSLPLTNELDKVLVVTGSVMVSVM